MNIKLKKDNFLANTKSSNPKEICQLVTIDRTNGGFLLPSPIVDDIMVAGKNDLVSLYWWKASGKT